MRYTVELTPQADRQLRSAYAWYANQDVEVGHAWYNGFLSAIRSLTENPQRCGLARESEDFTYEVFAMLYGSGRRKTHRAVFRIVGQTVEVVAIRHHAQRDLHPEDISSAD